jgi:hypothetical protein
VRLVFQHHASRSQFDTDGIRCGKISSLSGSDARRDPYCRKSCDTELAGQLGNIKKLPKVYQNKTAAQRAARREWDRIVAGDGARECPSSVSSLPGTRRIASRTHFIRQEATESRLRHRYQVATVRHGSQLTATSRASLRETGSPEK